MTGDEYVIIGYDSTSGCGDDSYILKTDGLNLPVYWLITDLICYKLENFNEIINMLSEYSDYFYDNKLNEKIKKEIIDKICTIEDKDSINEYWNHLLNSAMSFED